MLDREKVVISSLVGLLHDVGKPLLRYKHIAENLPRKGIPGGIPEGRTHEDISEAIIIDVVRELGITVDRVDLRRILEEIRSSDRFAAAERGVNVPEYTVLTEFSQCVENMVKNYNPDYVPMLIPTYILRLSGYSRFVGPGSTTYMNTDIAKEMADTLMRRLRGILEALVAGNAVKACSEFVEFVNNEGLLNREVWIPIGTLREFVDRIRGNKGLASFDWVINTISNGGNPYEDVVKQLLLSKNTLPRVFRGFYASFGKRIDTGFVDTMLHVMRATTMFVPAAVFASVLPDTSLYAHSKLVAALSAVSSTSASSMALVTLDARGIQRFISAPVKWGAASRSIRGRSLIMQLAMESLRKYALELFNVSEANAIADRGGVVDIVVPATDGYKYLIQGLQDVANELSRELLSSIAVAVACTEFTSKDMPWLLAMGDLDSGFRDVIDRLGKCLARKKSSIWVNQLGINRDVEGLDEQTREPVLAGDPFKIIAYPGSPENEYLNVISGGHIKAENKPVAITGVTHRALVAGTASRNLVALVSLHMYEVDANSVLKPYRSLVYSFLEAFKHAFWGGMSGKNIYPLYTRVSLGTGFMAIGLIPFASTGTVHILVSTGTEKLGAGDERARQYEAVVKTITGVLVDILKEALKKTSQESKPIIRIDYRAVNILEPEEFAREDAIRDVFKKLEELAGSVLLDASFGFVMLNPWHPIEHEEESGETVLLDLDKITDEGLIGFLKADLDRLGDVVRLYASWPSRLITLSEYIDLVLKAITYIDLLDKTELRNRIVPLYAGGDDVAVYGKWDSILEVGTHILRRVNNLLQPLTASMGIAIDDYTTPLLETYRKTVELLEGSAKKFRASVTIGSQNYLSLIRVNNQGRSEYLISEALPANNDVWGSLDPVSLEHVVEILKASNELKEFTRDLRSLSLIGNEFMELIRNVVDEGGGNLRYADMNDFISYLRETARTRLLELEIYYKYIWIRKRSLKNVEEIIQKVFNTGDLHLDPETVRAIEGIRLLSLLKLPLDLVLLKIRLEK